MDLLGIIQVKPYHSMVFSHLLGCTPSIQLKKLDSQSYLTDNAKSSISSIDCFDLFCLEKDSMDFQHDFLLPCSEHQTPSGLAQKSTQPLSPSKTVRTPHLRHHCLHQEPPNAPGSQTDGPDSGTPPINHHRVQTESSLEKQWQT